MQAQSLKTRSCRFASAAILVTLVGVFVAPSAFAARRIGTNAAAAIRITMNANNPRELTVNGKLGCNSEGPRAYIHVTVTQRSTGAVAEGSTVASCTGDTQDWVVRAGAQGKPAFEEGTVTIVYFIHSAEGDFTTDAHQWLVVLDLEKED